MSGSDAMVEMPPVFGRRVRRVETQCLNGVDRPEHMFDPRPAIDTQEDFPARTHERQSLEHFASPDRAHDIQPGDGDTEVIGRPAHEGENTSWRKAGNATAVIKDLLVTAMPEAQPVFDAPV
jgi:hypothetical protein